MDHRRSLRGARARLQQNLGVFTLAGLIGLALVDESELPTMAPSSRSPRSSTACPHRDDLAHVHSVRAICCCSAEDSVAWMMPSLPGRLLVAHLVAPLLVIRLERAASGLGG